MPVCACPHCKTQLWVNDAQLNIAQGFVVCSQCEGLFQARDPVRRAVDRPGGDALQDLVARTADALRMALAQHTGQTVVFVGHDSVNRAMLLQALDQPLSAYWRVAQSPCAINEFDVDGDGRITVKRLNDTGHLDAKLSP